MAIIVKKTLFIDAECDMLEMDMFDNQITIVSTCGNNRKRMNANETERLMHDMAEFVKIYKSTHNNG